MRGLKYEGLNDPALLERRAEANFPLIYVGDRVVGSS